MITVYLKPKTSRASFPIGENPANYFSGGLGFRMNNRPHAWRPPTDIYATDDKYIVLVEVAGMKDEDFTITVDKNILHIQGHRTSTLNERRAFYQMEIPFGEFITEIEFPDKVEINKVEASYENGFLKIELPKAQPHHIDINKD